MRTDGSRLAPWLAFAIAAVALAGCATPPADDALTVHAIGGQGQHTDRFEPASLHVAVGDTVTFKVDSGAHTVDFEEMAGVSSLQSGNLDEGATHTVTFTEPGTFAYRCAYHVPGMVGSVVVE